MKPAILTSHQTLADAVGENMAGQLQASKFLSALRTTTPEPDALYFELLKSQGTPARARGFARCIQKAIERAGGAA